MKKLILIGIFLFSFISNFAGDIVWQGSTSTNWHTASNWVGGVLPGTNDVAVFNFTSSNNVVISNNVSIAGIRIETGYFGVITHSGGSITLSTGGFQQSGGTFVGGSSVISISGNYILNGGVFTAPNTSLTLSGALATVSGGTFNHNNGTVYKAGGYSTWSWNQNIKNLDINTQGGFTTYGVKVLGNVDARNWNAHIGDLTVEGNYTIYFSSQSSCNGKVIFSGNNNQTLSAPNGTGCISGVEVNKPSGTLTVTNNILVQLDWTNITDGTRVDVSNATPNFTFENDVTSNGMIFNDIIVNCPGWFNAVDTMRINGLAKFQHFNSVNGVIEASGNVQFLNPTQSVSTATLFFVGSNNQTLSANGSYGVFSKVLINKTGGSLTISDTIKLSLGLEWISGSVNSSTSTVVFYGGSQTVDAEGINFNNVELNTQGNITLARPLKVDGSLTVTAINLIEGERVEVKGNLTYSDDFFWGNGVETYLVGSNNQNLSFLGTSGLKKTLYIDKPAGEVVLTSDTSWASSLQNVFLINGTFNLNGKNLTLGGTFKNSGTIKLIGSEVVTLGGLDQSGQGTVTYTGIGTYSQLALGDEYYHLNIAGNATQDAPLTVRGNLNITGNLNSNGQSLFVGGNFSNSGTYTSGNNSVYLIGKDQTITGSNSFYNLIKRNNQTSSITFTAGTTQTITNKLELVGSLGNLLSLKSSTPGSSWSINYTGSQTQLGYLNISDSTSVTTLDAKNTSVNGGNNTNWVFNGVNLLAWTGAVNNNFSNAGNWVGNVAPTANDVVEFLSGSSAVNMDIDANVAGITMGGSFSGSFTMAANKTLTVGYNGITINAGTFTANTKSIITTGNLLINGGTLNGATADIEVVGNVEITGGTFNTSTKTLKVGGNWTKTSGNFEALGSVTFNGFGGQVINAGGTGTDSDFKDVAISFGTVTIASPIQIVGSLTINSAQLKNQSQIYLTKDLTNNSGYINDSSGATWVFNGANTQNIKVQNHKITNIQITNTSNIVAFTDELKATNLTANAGTKITLEKDKFYTFTNLTLNGTQSAPIQLRSSIAQQSANVIVSGTQAIAYTDVRGIDGRYGPVLNGTNNCVDLGYNVNWTFPNNTGKPIITFTPSKDIFEGSVSVTLSSTGTAPIIYYTLDGSTPTTGSTVFSSAINLTATTTIKAISVDGANTSIVFAKVYQAVQSAIDDGLVYPVKSYGLNALIYLGDSRRFEGEAWHVGPDGIMNTTDDYRVPEFDKYIVWSCTGGTIQKITGTGGAVFTDDGYISSYTVTLTLGPKTFTGCNNCTPPRRTNNCPNCTNGSNAGIICNGPENSINETSILPPEENDQFPGWFQQPEMMTEEDIFNEEIEFANEFFSNYPPDLEGMPILGDSLPGMGFLSDAGSYGVGDFTLGHGGRLQGLPQISTAGNNQVLLSPNVNAAGAIPFGQVGTSNSFMRDGGNSSYISKIPSTGPGVPNKIEYNAFAGGKMTFEQTNTGVYQITSRTDRNGNVTNYDYSTSNMLKITYPSGSKTEITADLMIDGKKQITKIEQKPFGASTSKTYVFEYDANGFLKSQKFQDSQNVFGYGEAKFTHDIHGNLTSYTNLKGNTYTREYDDNWRITKHTLPTGLFTTKEYSGRNGAYTIKETDPSGKVTKLFRNQTSYGIQTTKVEEANGLVVEFQFDNKSYVTQETRKISTNSAENIVTLYEYDVAHNITKTTIDPTGLSLVTRAEFDAFDNLTKKIDANGKINVFNYTANHKLASQIIDFGGLNITTSYTYDSTGNLLTRTDPMGKIKSYQYDSFGNCTKITDELGKFETYTYDAFGNKTSRTNKNGNVLTYEYDVNSRLTKRTDPTGNYETYEYDAHNYITRFTDRLGAVTTKTYDSLDHITFIGGDSTSSSSSGCSVCGSTKMNGTEGEYTYSWNGKLLEFIDANYVESNGTSGTLFHYQYDNAYRNTAIIADPYNLNIITEKTVDKLGRMTETRTHNQTGDDEIHQFGYDKASRLLTTKQVLGNTILQTQYEYDNTSNKTKTTDANGNFTQTFYDGANRVTKTIDAEGTEYQNIYNNRSELIKTIADVNGFAQTTEFTYSDRGDLLQTKRPAGGIEICEYDNAGNKTKCTDPMGGVKEWVYNNRNLVVTKKDELGYETHYTYNQLGKILSEVNNQGTITSYIYGEKSFLEKVIEDVGGINATTEYTRDEYGRILDTKDASGTIYRNVYDVVYRVTQTIADVGGKNITSSTVFDSLSRPVKTINAGGFETNNFYDQSGRLTKVVNPDGGEQSFIYDNESNVIETTNKVSATQNYVESYEYNKLYQVTKTTEDKNGLQIITQKAYDSLHRLTTLTDAKNQVTSYEFDIENRITKVTYADGNYIVRNYDLDGRLTSKTDQAGDVCNYSYSARDELLQQTYGTTGIKAFTYDSLGRRSTDSDNNNGNKVVTSTYTYDRLHRNLTDTQKIGTGASLTNAKAFNAFGDVIQVTLPSGKVITQTYTAIHQPSSIVSDIGNGTETIARYEYNYESAGTDKRPLVKKKVLATGAGIKTDYSYDTMSRLITINSKNSLNNTVVGFEHTYDLVGNRITDKHLHRLQDSETYGYDTALRFNDYKRGTIGGTPSFTQAYTLDKLANWTSFNNNGTIENRTHSVMNEITSINSQALTHDIKGNLTTNKNGDKYFWDKLNRLVEVRDSSNNQIALYYYNADNLRVQKTTITATEQYYYSGTQVVVETDSNQTITKEYIHGGQYIDEVITVTTNGQTYFYLYDLRFNVYGLTDVNGNIVERIRYQGYGKAEILDASFNISTSVVDQPFTYTGQRLDAETGLLYFRLRYFDAELGRFISRDPIGYFDGMSLYRAYFVLNGLDSFGLFDLIGAVTNKDEYHEAGDLIFDENEDMGWRIVGGFYLVCLAIDDYTNIASCGLKGGAKKGGKKAIQKGAKKLEKEGGEKVIKKADTPPKKKPDTPPEKPPETPPKTPKDSKRLPQDEKVDPKAPPEKDLDRPIGKSPTQNKRLQDDIKKIQEEGGTDIRVNQQQVNAKGERVGVNRPDLQYTDKNGQRHYIEYDTKSSNRGPMHEERILSNDPNGKVTLIEQD